MIGRRFGPLVVLVVVGIVCVLLRSARIQVTEHETWAKEAANLERSSRRLPYHRGKILASGGEVLVEDEERYLVSFEWREFRRENPIGQVALASSAWTGEAVELISDPDQLGARANELLEVFVGRVAAAAAGCSIADDGPPRRHNDPPRASGSMSKGGTMSKTGTMSDKLDSHSAKLCLLTPTLVEPG